MVVADSHTVLAFKLFAQSQDSHEPFGATLGITDSESKVTDWSNGKRYRHIAPFREMRERW